MELFNPEVQAEFDRVNALVTDDPFASQHTLGLRDVLRAHFLIADFFITEQREIGGVGPKDMKLLESALYRAWVEFGGVAKWTDPLDKIATTLFGLIKDHPFHDANKRTALLSTVYLLSKQGRMPRCSKDEFEDFTVEIAEMEIAKRSRFRELERDEADPEVKYISVWLRRNTRRIDDREYTITYRELRRILQRHGFVLENPNNNSIDLVQVWPRSGVMAFLVGKESRRRIARIGYPGDTKQVSKGDLRYIRRQCELTSHHGVDSQSFYWGVDDMTSLLAEYQENLRRLANR
ncbi:death-on-curing family protein [Bradyrhizobium diazoefficiens]